MKNLLNEMQAFLDGRDSSFTTVLPNLPTSQIEKLNQYLTARIGEPAQVHEMYGLPTVTSGQAEEVLAPTAGTGTPLSWSDLAHVKFQVDQQLTTIRTELQSVFGFLPDAELTSAAAQFDDLSLTALIDGAKRNTLDVLDLLESQRGAESSLVDDVWLSMGQAMHSDSLVTSGMPLDGLLHGGYLSTVPHNPLFSAETGDMHSPVEMPGSSGSTSQIADADLIDLMHAAVLVTPIIPAGYPNTAGTPGALLETPSPLFVEDLFRPLSASTNADPAQPGVDIRLDKFA